MRKDNSKNDYPIMIDAAEKGKAAIVFIFTLTSDTSKYFFGDQTGSGVIISDDGYIVTNHHVIERGIEIHILLDDKREYIAELIGADSTHDVALLKIKANGLPFLQFGDNDSLRIGEPVLAVGNPYRLQSTVTSGIISAIDRDIKLENNVTRNFIQMDVPINLGNSGGALVNTKGQLMGLNTAIISSSGEYEGFSFALPSNLVKKIVSDLREFGTLRKASIGFNIRPVSQGIAHESGMNEIYGVVVESLKPGGAADSAGIQSLDILLDINDRKITSIPDFMGQLELFRPGDVITLRALRNGTIHTIDVHMQEVQKD